MLKKTGLFVLMVCIFSLTVFGCSRDEKQQDSITQETETPPQSTDSTEEHEAQTPILLGEAQTDILDAEEDRVHNIKLAADTLNGFGLASGEVFSFNEVLGDRTKEKGYRDAAVIVKGEKEEGCGGGVCQVSTTLYQAANSAGMTIIERNSHQKEVPYAGQGEDAAVNYGSLDLRFKNNLDFDVRFEVYIENEMVIAKIYKQ